MRERRKLKRRSMSYYMPVIDPKTEQIIGHLVDITMQGLMMDSQLLIPIDKDWELRLNVTADVADKNYIEFLGRCKWCQPDALEPYLNDIGFEIISISPHDAEIIQRIVDKYGARENTFNF